MRVTPTEDDALAGLAEMTGEITAEWAKQIIDKLMNSVPDTEAAGYFKFSDDEETVIPEQSKFHTVTMDAERSQLEEDLSVDAVPQLVLVELLDDISEYEVNEMDPTLFQFKSGEEPIESFGRLIGSSSIIKNLSALLTTFQQLQTK